MSKCAAILALGLAVFQGIGLAQATPVKPQEVNVCDIVKEPERFNGKMIPVRGRISIAFEDFELSAAHCAQQGRGGIWLEYGRGPKSQPTTWCCGDMTPRDKMALVQNQDFRSFHRFLAEQRRVKGCYEGQCYVYDVTATITGRLDAVKSEVGRNGRGVCDGFGHFGVFCARLVIQKVSDVVADRATELKRMK
jgi:hypothetical protein